MKSKYVFLGVCLALLLVISGVTAFWVLEIRNSLPTVGGPYLGPGDLTVSPTPGRTGPYSVCTYDYDLSGSIPGRAPLLWGYGGRIYVPVVRDDLCDELDRGNLLEANRDFNLVVIAHADGEGLAADAHLNYEGLANHLASNALMVVSINRYASQSIIDADAVFPSVLQNHLDYLYNSSPVRNAITNDVALIGHSAGGRSVIRHSDTVASTGQSLRAVVLLAPTMFQDDTISFNGLAGAFMGLSVTNDSDDIAYGSKAVDEPMLSNFRIFDEAGVTGNPGIFTLEKDLVFVESCPGPFAACATQSDHYFQNQPFALAYINAFLQQYLNMHKIFERFLKYQERPPSLNASDVPHVWHQHEDASRFTLADFENGLVSQTELGGSITYSGGIDNETVGQAAVIDPFSPHNSSVLYFETVPGQHRVTFDPPGNLNLGGYSWLGLRITQVYHPDNNPAGGEVDFTIRLRDAMGVAVASISDHGGALHFPLVRPAPLPPQNAEPGVTEMNGQTKNAMRSYLVRLSAFEGVDLTAIQSIEIDFGNGQAGLVLIMDDLAFYQF